MKVTLLGTGSPLPSPDCAGPSTMVQSGATSILVDAGRGVVMRLAGAHMVPALLSGVLLTHLHSDHISDLNDVVTSHWVMHPTSTPLAIFGPRGTRQVVDGLMAMLAPDIGYRLAHHEDLTNPPLPVVTEVEPGDTFALGEVSITVHATDHRPVEPTVGYRMDDGAAVVALAGDGVPCASLDELVADATVYVQTVIREDLVSLVPNERFIDILDYHSTVGQAADTAERGGVTCLMLTHFVPGLTEENEGEWRDQASAVTGQLILGPDLTSFDPEA